jgi:hypothetical protein
MTRVLAIAGCPMIDDANFQLPAKSPYHSAHLGGSGIAAGSQAIVMDGSWMVAGEGVEPSTSGL